jgi:hypothetical protein
LIHRRGLAALVTGLVLAGCGHTSLSLIQLRSRASTICARADRRLQAIPAPSTGWQARGFLRRGLATLGPELSQLRTLSPPRDVLDVYASAMGALSAEAMALRQAVRALTAPQADPIAELRALQRRLGPLEQQADDAWQALGVPACISR